MAVQKQVRVGDFLPSKNGFRFVNSFPGMLLPKLLENFVDPAKTNHGLCGGMCFAVIDYQKSQQKPPPVENVPDKESPLYEYINKRQLDSWGQMMGQVARYVQWMGYSDEKALAETAESWQALRENLDDDQLTVLGLIYNDFRESVRVWDNHQVLAYGYNIDADGSVRINLYDPNYPERDDVYLKAEAFKTKDKGDAEGLKVGQYVGDKLHKTMHGFFLVPYEYEEPPRNVTGVALG